MLPHQREQEASMAYDKRAPGRHSDGHGALNMEEPRFTPALGRLGLTGAYDVAVGILTRERLWRAALLEQLAPRDGETILDVGCGTGTFAIMAKRAAPGAFIIGLDPDESILERAAEKAQRAELSIEWRQGFARDAANIAGTVDKVVSSLVFHQTPFAEKRAGLAAMFKTVATGGEIHIADYAFQPDKAMRRAFRVTVQLIDGIEDTQQNADGALENILSELVGRSVTPTKVLRTLTGAISLFKIEATLTR